MTMQEEGKIIVDITDKRKASISWIMRNNKYAITGSLLNSGDQKIPPSKLALDASLQTGIDAVTDQLREADRLLQAPSGPKPVATSPFSMKSLSFKTAIPKTNDTATEIKQALRDLAKRATSLALLESPSRQIMTLVRTLDYGDLKRITASHKILSETSMPEVLKPKLQAVLDQIHREIIEPGKPPTPTAAKALKGK